MLLLVHYGEKNKGTKGRSCEVDVTSCTNRKSRATQISLTAAKQLHFLQICSSAGTKFNGRLKQFSMFASNKKQNTWPRHVSAPSSTPCCLLTVLRCPSYFCSPLVSDLSCLGSLQLKKKKGGCLSWPPAFTMRLLQPLAPV